MKRPDLLRRRDAVEATLAQFEAMPFDWQKRATCIHLFRAHARHMGHKMPPVPRFRSALGARRALKSRGFEDLASLLDSFLPRIPPAAGMLGDVGLMGPDELGALDAIVILGGDGKVFGWSEHDMSRPQPIDPVELKGVWRL